MEEGRALLTEINRARQNPQGCIEDIKKQLACFQTATSIRTQKGERMKAIEGKAAWQDAILYLERCKPKQPLNWSPELTQGCIAYEKHHSKGEEVSPFKILKNIYEYQGNLSFTINESEVKQNYRDLVIAMIISDGDEQRGNRTTIFHPTYRSFGGVVVTHNKQTVAPLFFSDATVFKPVSQERSSKDNTPSKKSQSQFHQGSDKVQVSFAQMMKDGKDFLDALNNIRKQPKKIIPLVKADIGKFKQQKNLIKNGLSIKTKEGKIPYEDLASELQEQYPIPFLRMSEGLCIAAALQVMELQKKAPGEPLDTKHNQYLKKYTLAPEGINNVVMNRSEGETIVDMLILLLAGDGDKKRSARRNLLSPIHKVAGVAIGSSFFVVNVGQNCRDNKDAVQNFNNKPEIIEPSPTQVQKFENKKISNQPMQSSQKSIKKKTTKTTTLTRGGKNYKVIKISIVYEDGTTEEVEEEELL